MTLLRPKFQYSKLTRDESTGKRLYVIPGGAKVPSVTTILSETKPEESRLALEEWRKNVGETRAKQITTEAANRGTRMHAYLEDYIAEGFLRACGSNPYSKISHMMANQIITHGFKNVNEVWGSEVPLFYDGLYAGTTDMIGVWKGLPAILDFKQSNKPKQESYIEDYYLQLAAYALANNHMHGTNIKTGIIMMCVQPKTNAKLEIIENPQYQEFVLEGAKWSKYEDLWWDRVEAYYRSQNA